MRIFLVFSYYHLAYVSTRSRAVALIAAVVLTSFTHGYLGTYLGAVPLVERGLLVRSAALPLAFMALAAAIGQRHALAAVWLGLTFLFHPVTGINAFGVCLVYGILSYRTLAWQPFLLAVLAVGGVIGGYVFFMGGERHVPLFLDPQWRHIVDETVGGYVFITPEIAAKKFWATVIPGLLAVLVTRSPRLSAIYYRFAVAAGLAVVVHFLAADVAGFVPLFHCCPERASFALVAISGIGLAAMIHELWRLGRRSSRALAAALLAGLLLQLHFLLIAILFTASLPMLIGREGAGTIKRPSLRTVGWGCGLLSLGLLLVFGRAVVRAVRANDLSHRLVSVLLQTPDDGRLRLEGLGDVRRLGISDDDFVNTQRWIKEHSQAGDTILPPRGTARGWQVFSERSYVGTGSLIYYTNLSRELALRYDGFVKRVPSGANLSWREMVQFGRREGATGSLSTSGAAGAATAILRPGFRPARIMSSKRIVNHPVQPAIVHAADYAAPYGGNFMASLAALAALGRQEGFRMVTALPEEARGSRGAPRWRRAAKAFTSCPIGHRRSNTRESSRRSPPRKRRSSSIPISRNTTSPPGWRSGCCGCGDEGCKSSGTPIRTCPRQGRGGG